MENDDKQRESVETHEPLVVLHSIYTRPLYAFSRDGAGILTTKPIPKHVSQGTHLDTWVISVFMKISTLPQNLDKFVRLCRGTSTEKSPIIAELAFRILSSVQDIITNKDAQLPLPVDRVFFKDLCFNLRTVVDSHAPLTVDEEIRALVRCPYVLINWVVAFGTNAKNSHTPDKYVKQCKQPYEPNWMHALLADIESNCPEFNIDPKTCALALNNEKTLHISTRTEYADHDLSSIYGTPRCPYFTTYVTANTGSSGYNTILNYFYDKNGSTLPRGLEVHRALMLEPTQAAAFEHTFLAANGITSLCDNMKFSLPVNLSAYYDFLCYTYKNLIEKTENLMHTLPLARALFYNDAKFDKIVSMPIIRSNHAPDPHDVSIEHIYMHPLNDFIYDSTLSKLVCSQYYNSTGRGIIKL
jgi:hypothetical protein